MITGIDLSLTSTGVAQIADSTLTTCRVTSSGHTDDSLQQRFDRQTIVTDRLLELAKGSDLVVIEGLFTGKNAGHLIDRAGLWWRVSGSLLLWDIPVLVVPGTSAKLFLTGKGSADKGSMVRAAGKLWPDWEPSSSSRVEDEADAIALVSVGLALVAQAAGTVPELPFDLPDYRLKVLEKLQPQFEGIW